jgi:formylglycine-generating enzyme required for sulfatase activity
MPGPQLVTVTLSHRTFCMDATEVTNADYAAWLDTAPDPAVQSSSCVWNETFLPWQQVWPFPPGHEQHPVAGVDFCDAEAYCHWAGKRLCRADPEPDGIHEFVDACTHEGQQEYPYGDSFDPTACNGPELATDGTVPVASLSSCEGGYEGLFDLVGNLSEWADGCERYTGPILACPTLGGAWLAESGNSCNTNTLFWANLQSVFFGFRCCRDAE